VILAEKLEKYIFELKRYYGELGKLGKSPITGEVRFVVVSSVDCANTSEV
jgi:hypothetical protein